MTLKCCECGDHMHEAISTHVIYHDGGGQSKITIYYCVDCGTIAREENTGGKEIHFLTSDGSVRIHYPNLK